MTHTEKGIPIVSREDVDKVFDKVFVENNEQILNRQNAFIKELIRDNPNLANVIAGLKQAAYIEHGSVFADIVVTSISQVLLILEEAENRYRKEAI